MTQPEHQARRRELTFMKQLANAIGLPTANLGLNFPEHLTAERLSEARRQLGETALQAVKAQQLGGRLALQAYQIYGSPSLKHGSYLSPEQLTPNGYNTSGRRPYPRLSPQQAYWRDGQGRLYKDGEPAICTADSFEYPLLRSQLNRNHLPDFKGLVLSSHTDISGVTYDFTSQEFLSMLQEGDHAGWVYILGVKNQPDYQEKYRKPTATEAWEYRLFDAVSPEAWVATSPSDLPLELLVINGEAHDTHEFIRTLSHSTLMEHIQNFEETLSVQPLGSLFPLALHPNIS